jgi:uracil-DNA glycosylase family 4
MGSPYDFEDQIFINELKVPEICLRDFSHDQVLLSITHCQSCSSVKLTKPLTLHNVEASIMFIGERPDDVLFDSPQGKKLANLLVAAGLDLNDIYFTAMTKCRESNSFARCQHHLTAEIMIVRPKLIVCLGYNVCKFFHSDPHVGHYIQVYPNVHALFTYSLMDAVAPHESSVLQVLQDQFKHIASVIKNFKQQSA